MKEKAKKLRSSLNADILAGNTTNILAMTFRQVTLQKVWSYTLTSFYPGTERNMEDLAKPREVPNVDRTLSLFALVYGVGYLCKYVGVIGLFTGSISIHCELFRCEVSFCAL